MLIRAKTIIDRLEHIENVEVNVHEAQVLSDLKSMLENQLETISASSEKHSLLLSSRVNITLGLEQDAIEVLQSVASVSEKFEADPKSTTLKTGPRWANLMKKLSNISDQYLTRLKVSWQVYFDESLFGGLAPDRKGAVLAQTPFNDKAIVEYEQLWQEFILYRSNIPSSLDEISKLHTISEELAEITFEENVPDEVREFFEAARSGAPLSLVTDVVRNWLTKHKLIDQYAVRVRHD